MGDIIPVLRPRVGKDEAPWTVYGVWFYLDEIEKYDPDASKLKSWFKNRFNNFKPEAEIVRIEITREDYQAYFAPAIGTSAAYADYTVSCSFLFL